MSGRCLIQATNTAGALPATLLLSPILSAAQGTFSISGAGKLVSFSDLFQYFRFKELVLKFRGGSGTSHVAGYYPDLPDTLPTTQSDVFDAPWTSDSVQIASSVVTPSNPRAERIRPSLLTRQNVKWWRTHPASTVDTQLEYQGALTLCASSASGISQWDMQYVCEFKGFTSANNTPFVLTESKSDDDHFETVSSGAREPPQTTWGATENKRVALTRTQARQLQALLPKLQQPT